MRNFIGSVLIGLAWTIKFLHNMLLFMLLIGFCMGILMMTMIAFFELIGRLAPEQLLPFDLFGKWYWEAVVTFIGGATIWQGFKKMTEDDLVKNEITTK